MKVVVTGGSGHVGQWVVKALRPDHDVLVFDRNKPPRELKARYFLGEHEDLGQVIGALAGADAVVHVSGIIGVGVIPNEVLFRTNIIGTFNVHEAAARVGIRKVVSTSSEAVVGLMYRFGSLLPRYLPVDEEHPLLPHDSYSLAKFAGEAIARGYAERHGMTTPVLRPAWVVGPEDFAHNPRLTRGEGFPLDRFGLFAYVDARDLAEAYRLVLESDIVGHDVFFACADDSTTYVPLCELLPRVEPALGNLAVGLTGHSPGLSNAKLKRRVNWHPTHSWRDPKPWS